MDTEFRAVVTPLEKDLTNSLPRDLELLFEVGTLRFMARTWRQFGGIRFANVAEHSLRVAWFAMILAKHEGADSERCLQMALVHDLEETRTGDRNYITAVYTKTQARNAADDALADTSLETELKALWLEYHERESLEARIVKDADSLDCDLELREQCDSAAALGRALSEARELAHERLFTPTARKMQTLILEADPHSWHSGARNKFTHQE